VPADGYLRRVLADGALPFRYRGGVRALLGEPDGPGLLRAAPPAPQPQLSYPRPAWTGEVELPDDILTMARGPLDWPAGNDPPGSDGDHGTAAGGFSRGMPDGIPEPAAGHPPAAARRAAVPERPAAAAEPGPRPEAAASQHAVTDLSSTAVPGPAPGTSAGPAHAARPMITEAAPPVAAGPRKTQVAETAVPAPPQAVPPTAARPLAAAGPGPAGTAAAPAQREPKPAASAGGPRELLIPGKTVRSPLMAGSEEAGAGPDPSGPVRQVSQRQPGGPPRRSDGEPAGITGREQTLTYGSGERSRPDLSPAVGLIPPRPPGASLREHGADPVIPGRQASPLRVQRPAGPGRQADIGPARQAETAPRRPAAQAGIRRPAEQPPAAASVPAPQVIIVPPPRTLRSRMPPSAFWERRYLGRLWSRPLR
jgi:hypothetical protein